MRIVIAILVLAYSIWMFYESTLKNSNSSMDYAMRFRSISMGIVGLILFFLIIAGKLNIK